MVRFLRCDSLKALRRKAAPRPPKTQSAWGPHAKRGTVVTVLFALRQFEGAAPQGGSTPP